MATTIVARFIDGRLLVKESRAVEYRYQGSGVPVRVGNVTRIEEVLSLYNDFDEQGLLTRLQDVRVGAPGTWYSGQVNERPDHLLVTMRRGDLPNPTFISGMLSGTFISGTAPSVSGLVRNAMSGRNYLQELQSGVINISGRVTVTAYVIGY